MGQSLNCLDPIVWYMFGDEWENGLIKTVFAQLQTCRWKYNGIGAVTASGIGDMVKIDEIMDKKVHHNLLVRHAIPSGRRLLGSNFLLQDDSDPKHSCHYCRKYLRQKEASGALKVMV